MPVAWLLSLLGSRTGRMAAGGLVAGLLILVGAGIVYHRGYSNGAAKVQARWDAAVKKEIDDGTRARLEAEAEFPEVPADLVVPDGASAPGGKRVCHKPLDRHDRHRC